MYSIAVDLSMHDGHPSGFFWILLPALHMSTAAVYSREVRITSPLRAGLEKSAFRVWGLRLRDTWCSERRPQQVNQLMRHCIGTSIEDTCFRKLTHTLWGIGHKNFNQGYLASQNDTYLKSNHCKSWRCRP